MGLMEKLLDDPTVVSYCRALKEIGIGLRQCRDARKRPKKDKLAMEKTNNNGVKLNEDPANQIPPGRL